MSNLIERLPAINRGTSIIYSYFEERVQMTAKVIIELNIQQNYILKLSHFDIKEVVSQWLTVSNQPSVKYQNHKQKKTK